jgi:hypothetical protein
VYEGNAMKLVGRASITQAFASLARLADKVEVKYGTPVVVGPTGRIDGMVGNHTDIPPNLQVGRALVSTRVNLFKKARRHVCKQLACTHVSLWLLLFWYVRPM